MDVALASQNFAASRLGFDFVAASFRVCVPTSNSVLQRLKPHSLCCVYVVAEATTYKDFLVATQTLKLAATKSKP